ncbi:MAG: DMT family transporter, partial [Hyphomicrobiaceae bacterium]
MTETAVSAHRDEQQQVMLAMILMILAMLLLPAIDAIAKGLAGSVPPGQIAWSRFFFQLLLLAPFVLWRGGLEIGNYLWAHVARGVLIALATLCFFTAVRVMPLADAIAVFFVQPFIVTLLAAGLLGETFGWRRLVAIVCGFLGAMLIIKPSYEVFGLTALLPVGAALCFSLYFILTRWLTRTQTALGMQFLSGLFGCLAMSIALLVGG